MHPRTVALVSALSLTVGWSLNSRLSGPPPADTAGVSSRGPRPLGVETPAPTAPLTDQLRMKLDRQPAAPRPSRNPFAFGRPAPPATAAGRTSPGLGAEPAPPATAPGAPAHTFTLSGIAAERVADGSGVEYTAVLTGVYGLLFAHAGDSLPGGFEVVDVRETMVTLKDDSGHERTLSLR